MCIKNLLRTFKFLLNSNPSNFIRRNLIKGLEGLQEKMKRQDFSYQYPFTLFTTEISCIDIKQGLLDHPWREDLIDFLSGDEGTFAEVKTTLRTNGEKSPCKQFDKTRAQFT